MPGLEGCNTEINKHMKCPGEEAQAHDRNQIFLSTKALHRQN